MRDTKTAFAREVAARLGLNLEAMRADLGMARPKLAPLEPDAFFRWAWESGPMRKGSQPTTAGSLAFELEGALSVEQVRRQYVRIAAKVRRNQRLNLGPWMGIG